MEFIEVKNCTPDSGGITNSEIIRVADLKKIFKGFGDEGECIGFEFTDPVTKKDRQFFAYYPTTHIRDNAYNAYLNMLGVAHATERTGLSYAEEEAINA